MRCTVAFSHFSFVEGIWWCLLSTLLICPIWSPIYIWSPTDDWIYREDWGSLPFASISQLQDNELRATIIFPMHTMGLVFMVPWWSIDGQHWFSCFCFTLLNWCNCLWYRLMNSKSFEVMLWCDVFSMRNYNIKETSEYWVNIEEKILDKSDCLRCGRKCRKY